jgi:hypothetical protein
MKPFTNTTILIIFKDKSRVVFSAPSGKEPIDAYKEIIGLEKYDKDDVLKWYAFPKSPYTPEQYEKYWSHEKNEIDKKSMAINHKIEEFKKQRSRFMPLLDLEFMKSLEEDCAECKRHIVIIKNFLREGPEYISQHLESLDDVEKIITLNPFNNVFEIFISKKGTGYTSPPTVTISPPSGKFPGIPLKAVATLDGDGIGDVIVTQIGSSYIKSPSVTVSPPDDPNGEPAILLASNPENDIIDNMAHLETRLFED